MILVIGRNWGGQYAKVLERLGIPYEQRARDWQDCNPSGVIVATPAETHYEIAKACLARGLPVLVEKPITLKASEADALVEMGGIAFAGHTRLYSPAWRRFKAGLSRVNRVEAFAGGTNRDPWWDWGPHLVAMSLDIGCETPVIHVSQERQPLRFVVNDEQVFSDVPDDPLGVLCGEFWGAIQRGTPDNSGLRLGARVVHFLENRCPSRTTHP